MDFTPLSSRIVRPIFDTNFTFNFEQLPWVDRLPVIYNGEFRLLP